MYLNKYIYIHMCACYLLAVTKHYRKLVMLSHRTVYIHMISICYVHEHLESKVTSMFSALPWAGGPPQAPG